MSLLMVRDRSTGRFVYTEQRERGPEKTPWEYVRREAQLKERFAGEFEVLVGWGTGSVEEFLRTNPEYRTGETIEEKD